MSESGYVPVGDTKLFYEQAGDGPAIVFLHAGIADSRMWKHQMTALATDHRVVTFDQRGFGNTDWVPGPYADRRDVISVLDHLDIEQAVIVGCSLGGGVALHVALDSPDRVSGLVLVGAAARGWEPANGWSESPLWDEVVKASKEGDFDRVVELDAEMWVVGHGRTRDDVDGDVFDLVMEMDRAPILTESERNEHVEAFEPPVNDRIGEISAPTLVIVGAHDEPELVESAGYLAERLSDRPPVVVQGAAHLPSLERPDDFNHALRVFLTGL